MTGNTIFSKNSIACVGRIGYFEVKTKPTKAKNVYLAPFNDNDSNQNLILMKKLMYLLPFVLGLAACNGGGSGSAELSTEQDSISYSLGAYWMEQMKSQGIVLDPERTHEGYVDVQNEEGMSKEEYTAFLMNFSQEMGMRQGVPITEDSPLATNLDTLSYAIGADFSERLKSNDMEINSDAFLQGGKDFFTEEGPKIDLAGRQGHIMTFSQQMNEKQMAKMEAEGEENIKIGEEFLAENATKEGVNTTDSGLQYKVITEGAGPSPAATDIVKVHYEGRLLDGTVFDSSYERGEPIEFALNRVIPGWTEGLQLMNVGAKYQLYIPSGLAYGKRGSAPKIGSNETLIFDVELLEFKAESEQ